MGEVRVTLPPLKKTYPLPLCLSLHRLSLRLRCPLSPSLVRSGGSDSSGRITAKPFLIAVHQARNKSPSGKKRSSRLFLSVLRSGRRRAKDKGNRRRRTLISAKEKVLTGCGGSGVPSQKRAYSLLSSVFLSIRRRKDYLSPCRYSCSCGQVRTKNKRKSARPERA